MQLQETIPIVFNGGSYGTYLEWVLTSLTSVNNIDPPFTTTGSSHLFEGNHLGNLAGWQRYIDSNQYQQFVRLHPKTLKEEALSKNLEQIISKVNKMLYVYPSQESVLEIINNWASKINYDWWQRLAEQEVSLEKVYQNWPICQGMTEKEIPVWVRRELLSFYLMPSWHAQVEWYHPDQWQHPQCQVVLTKDLLYNFESTIMAVQQFCNLEFKRPITDIVPYHATMLALQKHTNQDQLCHQIVDSILHNVDFDWAGTNLPLPSQSWIQWQLRNVGYELKCHGLDIFPTNSVHLQELLYLTNQ
jgi:hypothetical protein